jgi:hypothetical protein
VCASGNAVLKGNEQTHRLAQMSVILNGREMDQADVLHDFHEAGKMEDSLEEGDSSTLARLRDGHFKLVTARQVHYESIQTSVVNQKRTDTLSQYMLLNILKKR